MMNIRLLLKTALLLALASSSACRFPYTRPVIPYQEVYEEIDRIPPGFLINRLFILDPGHGGSYSGAVTPDSLRECDINLTVARHLRSMLERAGARVIMTRYTDTDFIPPDTKRRLGTDLHARCAISNRHRADLFISLHHNASAFRHRKYNATETFVKMTDNRQSMDAAAPIHHRLTTILGTGNDKIIPGNFHVLRHNHNPAILGEAAYMTNKRFAKLLKDPAFLELEAAAYFLGITDYIGRDIPDISTPVPADTVINTILPEISAVITGGAGIDPATVEMSVNGTIVDHTFDPATGRAAYTPRDIMPNGRYAVTLDARNVNGNAARTGAASFTVNRPPAHLLLRTAPTAGAGIGTPVTVEAMVFDEEWTPVINGTPVIFNADRGHLRYGQGLTADGKVRTYCSAKTPDTVTVTARCGTLVVAQNIVLNYPGSPTLSGFVTDAVSGRPLPRATLRCGNRTATTGSEGYANLPAAASSTLGITRKGYIPVAVGLPLPDDTVNSFLLKRMFGGVLHGRRIVIDPEFGGTDPGAVGHGGTRAADVNLRVAKYLKQYLLKAGADAVLTRSSDRNTTDLERVLTEAESKTNLYIVIKHGTRRKQGSFMYTAHHYQSGNGKRAAKSIARELKLQTGVADAGMRADYGYAVMQTGCPAVVVHPGHISDTETEKKLARPAANRRSAYGIFNGILRYYGVQRRHPGQLKGTARAVAGGTPLSGALVTLDGHTVLQTGLDGRYLFRMLAKGKHTVTVSHGGRVVEERTVRVR